MSELLAIGISHKTAPVALRARLALTERAAARVMRELVDLVYSPRNCDAARHLFSVTAGLESMIVGESEVQGQVRRAYELALAAGTTGPFTNRLFRAALQTGKRVRSETAIGAARVSVSSVAVAAAREAVGDLTGRDVVIIGAGETAELTARALSEQGVTTMVVANRRADRARALAARFGGTVGSLDELPERLAVADIVVSSTSSPHVIVGADELELVMQARGGRPLALIDIAVPRDIDHACAQIPGVTLYDMDDLQSIVSRNIGVREGERERAQAVVEDEINRFSGWMAQQAATPTVAALHEHGAAIVEQVLSENDGRWESVSPRDLARIDAIARAVMQRLLHEPMVRLKGLEHEGGHGRLAVLRELFGLDEVPEESPAPNSAAAEPDDGAPADVRPLRRRP